MEFEDKIKKYFNKIGLNKKITVKVFNENLLKIYDNEKSYPDNLLAEYSVLDDKFYFCKRLKESLTRQTPLEGIYTYILNGKIQYTHSDYICNQEKFEKFNVLFLKNKENKIIRTILFDEELKFIKCFEGSITKYSSQDIKTLGIPVKNSEVYMWNGKLYTLTNRHYAFFHPAFYNNEFVIDTFPFTEVASKVKYHFENLYGEGEINTSCKTELDYILENSGESLSNKLKKTYQNSSDLKKEYPNLIKKNSY